MIKIEQAVIVEGKYDKIRLSSMIDAVIIETNGFAIFKNKEKQRLIRKLAEKRGILILTDSDSAGFKIRSFISGTVPAKDIIHAYIPDIFGKEKRKTEPSKEGKIGVEGVSNKVIFEALCHAGATCSMTSHETRRITITDLYEFGLSGGVNSKSKKALLLKYLDLPERLSTSSLVQILNVFMEYDDFVNAVKACGICEE